MDYNVYIKKELFILIPVLYVIGIGLKKSKIPDKKIPLIIGIIGIVLSAVWVTATSDIFDIKDAANALFTSMTQGILAAGASVYANQLIVQSKKEK